MRYGIGNARNWYDHTMERVTENKKAKINDKAANKNDKKQISVGHFNTDGSCHSSPQTRHRSER